MLERLEHAPDPFDKNRFEPGHFTSSGYVVSPDDRDVLLIFHESLQRWLQPGGHVEPADSSIIEAARREVLEEVGIRVEALDDTIFDIDVHDIPARGDMPAHKHFDVRFLFAAEPQALVAASDARDARWVPLGEVSTRQSDASVMRAVARIRSRA